MPEGILNGILNRICFKKSDELHFVTLKHHQLIFVYFSFGFALGSRQSKNHG